MSELVEMVTVVASGKSVLRPDIKRGALSSRMLLPGTVLRPGKLGFTQASIDSLVKRGRAVKVAMGTETTLPDRANAPTTPVPVIPSETDMSDRTGIGDMVTKPIPNPQGGASLVWGFNPLSLQAMLGDGRLDLVKLNAMIKERDASKPPAATTEEAIKILSSEFVAPVPPAPPVAPSGG